MTMRSTASLVAVLALGAASLAGTAAPGGAQTIDPLRVEWQSRDAGRGEAVISGYVYNEHQIRVQHVRLRVEPSSGPSGARTVYLRGTISARGREYFELRVPAAEGPYRVSVGLFDWSGCGDG